MGARYDRVAAALHWWIALFFLAGSGLALFRETFSPWASAMITAHKAVGLAILLLSLARLAWWLGHRPPPLPEALSSAERRAARTIHALLYFLIVAVPVAGWLFSSMAPKTRPHDWRGGEGVPELPLADNDRAAFLWHEVHEIAGFALVALFLLHAAAALRHRLRRDTIFDRMSGATPMLARVTFVLLAVWGAGLALDLSGVRFWP